MAAKAPGTIDLRKLCVALLAASLIVAVSAATFAARPQEATIRCRVMEAMSSTQFHVRLVIFHYGDAVDRSRLGALLKQYNGGVVQFRSGDRDWHAATVLRLRTCFGRGLLVFAASEAQLAEKQDFQLRFPESSGK